MKSLTIYLSFFLSFFIIHNALSQEAGDAVYNTLIQEYTLNDDGSTDYHEYKEIKLLSHMSFHRLYGETFVIYDPQYQELKINEAYTIMADGKKVVVPDNAFNEVLPRAAAHAAPYNHLREMVITHTGLEVGATIYLDYNLKSKPGYMQTFMGEEVIREIIPTKEKQVIIHIPANMELQYKVLNIRTAPGITEGKDTKTYTFSFKEMTESTGEWGTDASLLPRLFFSTAKDLERAYFPFVAQKAFTYQATSAMQDAVNKLKEEPEGELDLALAIQKMVVNEVGSWNLTLHHTAFKCRTPREVWESNAGTHLEKTVLMATLFQEAGLSAVPVAIIPEKYYDRNVGSLYMMKDFAVRVKTDDEFIYLSATHLHNQDLAYSLANKKMLLLDGAIESLRTMDPVNQRSEIICEATIVNHDNEKISGEMNVKLAGSANPYFRLSQDTSYAKKLVPGVTDVRLNTLSRNESAFTLELEKSGIFKEYNDYIFLQLFESGQGIASWGFTYIETGRQAPIKLRELITEIYRYTIELPEGYQLVSPPITVDIDNPVGSVKINLRQEGNLIYASREIHLKQDVINYSEFGLFTQIWEAWMNPASKEIVFTKAD